MYMSSSVPAHVWAMHVCMLMCPSIFAHMCDVHICMQACVYVCICPHVHTCMCRPEDNVSCLLQSLHFAVETGSLTNPGASELQRWPVCDSLLPEYWSCRCVPLCLVLGIQTQVLMV